MVTVSEEFFVDSVDLARTLLQDVYFLNDPSSFQELADQNKSYQQINILHGPPGNGKSSILQALAIEHGIQYYMLNIGSDQTLTLSDIKTKLMDTLRGQCLVVFEDAESALPKSKSNDSLWLKLGGEGYKLRIVDGMLQVKTDSALLGYIGVDSPFTDDGYFITGDSVEQDGDWIRILGRKSELINVGGEKVYPAEVETIILENKKILDTVVYGSKNPLLGQIVSAKISINQKYKGNFNISDFKKECAKKMPKYMVPTKIQIVDEIEKSERGKKIRNFK